MISHDMSPQVSVRPLRSRSYAVQYCVLFCVISALSLIHRYIAVGVYAQASAFAWHFNTEEGIDLAAEFLKSYSWEVFLGLKSDILFSLIASLILLPFGRIGAIVGVIGLSAFYSANIEHIRFNDSSIDLAFLGLAMDPTFIKAQTNSYVVMRVIKFAVIGFGLLIFLRWRPFRILAVIASPILACILLVPVAANLQVPIWIQSHPLGPKVGNFTAELDHREFKLGPLTDENPPLATFAGQNNVLLVFIEGISEYSLEKSDLTFLQSLASHNMNFEQYIGHQMITANGLYAAHTGFQPFITGVSMRWYGVDENSKEAEVALPHILRAAGYQTAFLQSAPLSYMDKEETLSDLGYEIVKGDEDFPEAHSRNGWGVDDLTLVEGTLAQIDTFDPDRPWLTTILTTGTHSPYNVPDTFEPENGNARIRAVRHAEHAIKALMAGLESRGLLESTVVIITADEARETGPGSALSGEILRNWLPLIIVHPDKVDQDFESPFSMIDLRNLILMLTGKFDAEAVNALIDSRDVFIFGNVRLDRMFYFDRIKESFFACNTDEFICNEFSHATDIREVDKMTSVGVSRFEKLQSAVASFETGAVACEGDPALC